MSNTKKATKFHAWLIAIRPKTLPAAASPVIVGSAMALWDGYFDFVIALAALVAAVLLQIGSNLANDVFDFKKGVDEGERLGPKRVTQSGLLAENEVYAGLVVVFGAAGLIGIYLAVVGGWAIVLIGLAAILAALAYSGGPFPFGYYGLGDLVVFIFFGPVAVFGTYYLQAGTVSLPVFLISFAPGLLITAILVVNNLRDIENDKRTGKKTLAVRIGPTKTQIEFVVCIAGSYLVLVMMVMIRMIPLFTLIVLGSLPLAYSLVNQVREFKGRALNQTLAGTGRLTLLFSILIFAGIFVLILVK